MNYPKEICWTALLRIIPKFSNAENEEFLLDFDEIANVASVTSLAAGYFPDRKSC
jgi:hypothetical protein